MISSGKVKALPGAEVQPSADSLAACITLPRAPSPTAILLGLSSPPSGRGYPPHQQDILVAPVLEVPSKVTSPNTKPEQPRSKATALIQLGLDLTSTAK